MGRSGEHLGRRGSRRSDAIVHPSALKLLSGEESLTDYQFNWKSIHHLFCKTCGIRSFVQGNIPEVGGAFHAIHRSGLDEVDLWNVPVRHVDGRNDTWDVGRGRI